MRIKKFLFSFVIILMFSVYVLYQRKDGGRQADVIVSPTPALTPVSIPIPIPHPHPTTPLGMYRDGTYTGSVADAYYGNIQVRATILGGKIVNIIFLQHPGDRKTSILINGQAMPILSQEAITVQSAQVDIVSGATDSSQAFQQSLAYALSQAK